LFYIYIEQRLSAFVNTCSRMHLNVAPVLLRERSHGSAHNLDSIDTISLTLNNGGNCRKQKPQTECHTALVYIKNYIEKLQTFLVQASPHALFGWFIYSRRCGVVCPTELGVLQFLKCMVFKDKIDLMSSCVNLPPEYIYCGTI